MRKPFMIPCVVALAAILAGPATAQPLDPPWPADEAVQMLLHGAYGEDDGGAGLQFVQNGRAEGRHWGNYHPYYQGRRCRIVRRVIETPYGPRVIRVRRCLARPRPDRPDRGIIRFTGTLTRAGVECPAVRADNGRLYTLATRRLRGLRPGDRVYVEGTRADISICMQGTTVNVRRIRPID